ncbi:hypothetical protein [Fluviicola sp.]|uniref:hypothetical protein n=1 Tax=Fluviicola sp. TaxID=1917219 RepID=UPI0031D39C8C
MHRSSIIILSFAALFAVNCSKKKVEPTIESPTVDYREKYTGNYSILWHSTYWQMSGITEDTTFTYTGQVMLGSTSNTLKFLWRDSTYQEFKVTETGKILFCDSVEIGSFTNDHHFEFAYTDDTCQPGPLGESYSYHLIGDK